MTAALQKITHRQSDIMHMMRERALSIDEIGKALGVTRPAARKHLEQLLQAGLVRESTQEQTGGRPRHMYSLTGKGQEMFPRQYGWFLGLLVGSLKKDNGSAAVISRLRKLAHGLVAEKEPALRSKPGQPHLKEVADFMNTLGFEANAKTRNEIAARNCVYHDLAKSHPEICQFDIALIEGLTRTKVDHAECIVRGGKECRFKICEQKPKG